MSLDATAITVSYDGRLVLDGVSLSLAPGRTVGLVGPSGVGKSTLARVMAGLLSPLAGQVTRDGVPVETGRGRMAGEVTMLFQSPHRSCSPRQRLGALIAEPWAIAGVPRSDRHERVAALAHEVGLTADLLGRLPAQVSDGQLQRAALARALASGPDYLICDEATAMLDPISTAAIVAVLRRRAAAGLGVLAISHDTELLDAWADEVVALPALGPERTPGGPAAGA